MMQSEWPTKHTNDTKRSSSGQNQSGFHLTYPWTESDNESSCIRLIFVLFVFRGQVFCMDPAEAPFAKPETQS